MTKEIKWIGPYDPTDRHADQTTIQEIIRLRKLTAKYRDALERITKSQYNADSKQIAHMALETYK